MHYLHIFQLNGFSEQKINTKNKLKENIGESKSKGLTLTWVFFFSSLFWVSNWIWNLGKKIILLVDFFKVDFVITYYFLRKEKLTWSTASFFTFWNKKATRILKKLLHLKYFSNILLIKMNFHSVVWNRFYGKLAIYPKT